MIRKTKEPPKVVYGGQRVLTPAAKWHKKSRSVAGGGCGGVAGHEMADAACFGLTRTVCAVFVAWGVARAAGITSLGSAPLANSHSMSSLAVSLSPIASATAAARAP